MVLEVFMHYGTKEKDNGDFTRVILCIFFVYFFVYSLYSFLVYTVLELCL